MQKKWCIIFQVLLLLWFFLDMIGFYWGDRCLVTRAYKDDGIFFIIYFLTVIGFVFKDKVGKWAVLIWTSMWFILQFLSHEWYTIFGSGFMGSLEGKIEYFSGTMQWLRIEGKYIPDIYHVILHILILCVWIVTLRYIVKNKVKRAPE